MFIFILISLLVLTLMWIMLAPVILHVDTIRGKYFVMLPGIVKASLKPGGSLFRIRLWVGFLPLRIDPFKSRTEAKLISQWRGRAMSRVKSKEESDSEEEKKTKKRRRFNLNGLRSGTAMAKAIRIKRFYLNIDTDDFMLNAQLIPVFTAINTGKNIRMTANFQGEASLLMDVRTSLGALLLAYIKTKLNK